MTIQRIFRKHGVPRVTARRFARVSKPPAQASAHPGDHLQLDVKFLPKLGREHKRYDPFTAIDACTRYRVLQIYSHNSTKSAVDFIERVRLQLPCAIKVIQTDHGSEFGTRFTWHLTTWGLPIAALPRGVMSKTARWNAATEQMQRNLTVSTTFKMNRN